jgi:translation initiation factor 1 (eIF-1/SUI1)
MANIQIEQYGDFPIRINTETGKFSTTVDGISFESTNLKQLRKQVDEKIASRPKVDAVRLMRITSDHRADMVEVSETGYQKYKGETYKVYNVKGKRDLSYWRYDMYIPNDGAASRLNDLYEAKERYLHEYLQEVNEITSELAGTKVEFEEVEQMLSGVKSLNT